MPHAERSIAIRRPVDQVYRFLADGRTATQWRSGPLEVSGLEPDRRIACRTSAGSVRPVGELELEAMGDATIVTFRLDAQLSGWRRIALGRFVQSTLDAEMVALDELRDVLER